MMKTDAQNPKPKNTVKSLDEEIAALHEKLARVQAEKREKERRELERNQKAIAAILRAEKLDTVPVEKWTAALPALRNVLKMEEPKDATSSASSSASRPEQTSDPAKAGQGAVAAKPALTEGLEAVQGST